MTRDEDDSLIDTAGDVPHRDSFFRVKNDVAVLIREAIGAVSTRPMEILSRALEHADLERAPARGRGLQRFIDGPLTEILREETSVLIGDAIAEQIRMVARRAGLFRAETMQIANASGMATQIAPPSLGPALGRAPIDREPARLKAVAPPRRPAIPIPFNPLRLAVVTLDNVAFSDISSWRGATMLTTRYSKPEELAESELDDRTIIVLDLRSALVPIAGLGRIVKGRDVVAWAMSDERSDNIVKLLVEAARSVVRCSEEAEPEDVAALCQNLRR